MADLRFLGVSLLTSAATGPNGVRTHKSPGESIPPFFITRISSSRLFQCNLPELPSQLSLKEILTVAADLRKEKNTLILAALATGLRPPCLPSIRPRRIRTLPHWKWGRSASPQGVFPLGRMGTSRPHPILRDSGGGVRRPPARHIFC